jgi:hypothetical protein
MTKNTTGRRTSLAQRAVEHLRALAKPHRFRIRLDVEGFPVIPGRYGQIEWFDGADLAVYAARPRLFERIWAIPGVRRHQTGDSEMRAVFPPEALQEMHPAPAAQACDVVLRGAGDANADRHERDSNSYFSREREDAKPLTRIHV